MAGLPVVYSDTIDRHAAGYKYGGFVSGILRAGARGRFMPGIRVDGFSINKSLVASPRLSAVFSLTDNLDITGAMGVQYQTARLFAFGDQSYVSAQAGAYRDRGSGVFLAFSGRAIDRRGLLQTL